MSSSAPSPWQLSNRPHGPGAHGRTGTGGDLPDGTFGTTQDIAVQEIQAVNR
ncbi:hypothetical protein ACWC4D_10930 [Streptomyces sp. NPDC001288]|uniref:hypothetical protein n=1 Tax=Streptomyces sp. NPDC001297 TaxID=3364559 RepID=UPI00368E9EE9